MQLAPGEKVLPADSLRGLHTPKTEYSLETHSQDATVLPGHTNPEPGWPRCNTSALPNPTCSLLADNLRSPPTPTSGTVAQAQPFSAPAALHRACPVSTLGGAGRAFPPASTSAANPRDPPHELLGVHLLACSAQRPPRMRTRSGQDPNPKDTPQWPRPQAGTAPSYLARGRVGRRNHPPSAHPRPAAPCRTSSHSEPPHGLCGLWASL